MRVLHIMASCWRGSGVAHAVVNYQRHISTRIVFDYLLYSKTENSLETDIITHGGKVYYSGRPTIFTIVDYYKWIRAFFEKHRGEYDAVQIHEIYIAPIILPLAKKNGIKTRILHSHTTKLSDKFVSNIRNHILFICARLYATDYFACSVEAGRVAFGNRVVNGKDFAVIPNAINVSDYKYSETKRRKIREQLRLSNDIVFGNIGRCFKSKNQLFLVDIFSEIHRKNVKTKLIIIGAGPLERDIQAKVERLGLCDSVIMLGECQNVGDYLSAIDGFIFPSRYEGLGIVLIEAQCNGLPCVVSKNLPSEISILPTLVRVELSKIAKIWADTALLQAGIRTEDAEDYIIKSGYEIDTAAISMESLYDRIIKKYE